LRKTLDDRAGSLDPIDVGNWNEQVYIRPTHLLSSSITSHDRAPLHLSAQYDHDKTTVIKKLLKKNKKKIEEAEKKS
jgi:hypothetical protein